MNIPKYAASGSLVFVCLTISGCATTARDAWIDVLKKCIVNDALGDRAVYLGPSNNVGPGSIWRQTSEGGYNLREDITGLTTDKNKVNDVIHHDASVSCADASSSGWNLSAGALLSSKIDNLDSSVQAAIRKADGVRVNVNSWAIDQLEEALFEQLVLQSPPTAQYRSDALKQGHFVVVKALRVSGFEASISFSKVASVDAKATISTKVFSAGSASPTLTAEWKSDNTLTLKSSNDFYVFAWFGQFKGDGFALGGYPVKLEDALIPKNPSLGRD